MGYDNERGKGDHKHMGNREEPSQAQRQDHPRLRARRGKRRQRHLTLEAPHPPPLSAHCGFLGSRPFSRINAFLAAQGDPLIVWPTY